MTNFSSLSKFANYRSRAKILLNNELDSWDFKAYEPKDFFIDRCLREIFKVEERSAGKPPYEGLIELLEKKYLNKPVFSDDFHVPEYQLASPNYPRFDSPVIGKGCITGGFMEPLGHSLKPECKAIMERGKLSLLPPSRRNLGIDYVVEDDKIRSWYSGRVLRVGEERGYGNRCHLKYDAQLEYNGMLFDVYGAYAHAKSFSVQPDLKIVQGEIIGIQGNTGGNYPKHIDYRQWILIDSKAVDLSPNFFDEQIKNRYKK